MESISFIRLYKIYIFRAGNSPVSIHAPARGATVFIILMQIFLFSFNPRTRAGCDYPLLIWLNIGIIIMFYAKHTQSYPYLD